MSDPAKYRTKEEVSKMKETRDPINHLKDIILDQGIAKEDALKKMDKEIRDEMSDIVDFCKNSPEPDAEELWTDVLVEA